MSPKRDYHPNNKVRERTARALECIRRLVNALGEGAMLATGEAVWMKAGTANVVTAVLSGAVSA